MPRTEAGRRRCAIYTRKASEEGLEQEFNSLAAQREACEAYIRSQQHEGWVLARPHYDDGGFSGGNLRGFLAATRLYLGTRLDPCARGAHRRASSSQTYLKFRD